MVRRRIQPGSSVLAIFTSTGQKERKKKSKEEEDEEKKKKKKASVTLHEFVLSS